MIVDLETASSPDSYDCDIAIIGAGAVGLTTAVYLSRHGANVMLLEAGGERLESRSQALFEGLDVGHPLTGMREGRFRMLGGTSNFWGGQLVRIDPSVIGGREWLDLDAWPISNSELDPYYSVFAGLLGLPDISDAELHRQLELDAVELDDDLEFAFSRWLRNPNLGQVFRGDIVGAALTTLIHANVVGFEAGPNRDGVRSVHVATLTGRRAQVRARRVVLACGTLEISRLLMLPLLADPAGTRDTQPAPWATNPWLGRGFMDQDRKSVV